MPTKFVLSLLTFFILAGLLFTHTFKLYPAQAAADKKSLSGDITITNTNNEFNGSTNIYEIRGNLTINNDLNSSTKNRTLVVFVDQSLTINVNILHPDQNTGLVFIVKGNVNINQSVTEIDAVIISQGIICTAFDGTSCLNGQTITPQLVINGSLISLKQPDLSQINPPPSILFRRTLDPSAAVNNSNAPAEKINHQVKYLVILRDLISDTYQKWSETP